jgi:hypothetical protein
MSLPIGLTFTHPVVTADARAGPARAGQKRSPIECAMTLRGLPLWHWHPPPIDLLDIGLDLALHAGSLIGQTGPYR